MLYILAASTLGMMYGLFAMSTANWHAYWMTIISPSLLSRHHIPNYDFSAEITFITLRWVVGYGLTMRAFNVLEWGFIGLGPTALLLASLGLGASSVGREYDAGTMNFVLTRPTRRRNLILGDWIVGQTAMVIIASGLAFPVLPFLGLVHAQGPGNILAGLPALWVLGAAVYGLAHFTTLVAGSASKGLVLSVATLLTFFFLPNALYEWWHVGTLLKAVDWTFRPFDDGAWPLSPFDWSAIAFWLAVAAGFLGASLAWIRWREM
jgi:ABC-type transport system involved in multi-copper enzyme maturation permease subunit